MLALQADAGSFSELDGGELSEIRGGMPLLGAALGIAVAIGGVALAGIVVGVAIYVWTHEH